MTFLPAARLCCLVLTLMLAGAAAAKPLAVTLVHQSAAEQQTQKVLAELLTRHDVSKWIITRKIRIDEDTIPHSHPVLTLHTRHMEQPGQLLSTFVHEQMHWFIQQHPAARTAAVRELRALYPNLPVGYPKGADSKQANWEHLIIIYLEMLACRELLGEQAAAAVMAFWRTDHYTTLVDTVLQNEARIGEIVRKHRLLP